jgi:DNA primase
MQGDVDVVKSRINIVDIVGEYVKLTKAGNSFKACCPFHQEKTPSFTVSEERQMYHCFGCGQGGDVFSFVMEMEGVGFREALTTLAERAGVELQNSFSQDAQTNGADKQKLYEALDLAMRFYEKQLWDGVGEKKILPYLRERGISDDVMRKFRLGFAPDGWHHMEKFLVHNDFEKDIGVRIGMLVKKDSGGEYYDRFRSRIIFPIWDIMGRVIGCTARALPGDDQAQAKYVNTPESILYHKSSVLYGMHLAKQSIKQKDAVVVVEGNMDVIAAHDAGVENVIAVSGTAMTDDHIRILKRYTKNFTLFFDADQAGITAARRSTIACLSADVQLKMIVLDGGKDAADIVKEDPAKLQDIIDNAQNAIMVFAQMAKDKNDLKDPHEKRTAIDDIAQIIAHVHHDIERHEWIAKCAGMFDVDERMMQKTVNSFRKDTPEDTQPSIQKNDHTSEPPDEIQMQMQRIYRSIILMMMAYPHVWEHIYKNRDRYGPVVEQNNIATLIREGPECNFSIGDFISKDLRRESLYKAAMKMQQTYESEREDGGSPIKDTETYIAIAQEQYNQHKMDRLFQKMTEAESRGDQEVQKNILKEINDLSQHIIRNT